MSHEEVGRRTQLMRQLAQEDRRAAIAASPNVFGHKAFLARATLVERRGAYPGPNGGSGFAGDR